MSRSIKLNVVKRIGDKSLLNRQSRRSIKNSLRSQELNEELELPNARTIVDDYDYCDHIFPREYLSKVAK